MLRIKFTVSDRVRKPAAGLGDERVGGPVDRDVALPIDGLQPLGTLVRVRSVVDRALERAAGQGLAEVIGRPLVGIPVQANDVLHGELLIRLDEERVDARRGAQLLRGGEEVEEAPLPASADRVVPLRIVFSKFGQSI